MVRFRAMNTFRISNACAMTLILVFVAVTTSDKAKPLFRESGAGLKSPPTNSSNPLWEIIEAGNCTSNITIENTTRGSHPATGSQMKHYLPPKKSTISSRRKKRFLIIGEEASSEKFGNQLGDINVGFESYHNHHHHHHLPQGRPPPHRHHSQRFHPFHHHHHHNGPAWSRTPPSSGGSYNNHPHHHPNGAPGSGWGGWPPPAHHRTTRRPSYLLYHPASKFFVQPTYQYSPDGEKYTLYGFDQFQAAKFQKKYTKAFEKYQKKYYKNTGKAKRHSEKAARLKKKANQFKETVEAFQGKLKEWFNFPNANNKGDGEDDDDDRDDDNDEDDVHEENDDLGESIIKWKETPPKIKHWKMPPRPPRRRYFEPGEDYDPLPHSADQKNVIFSIMP